MAPKAAKRSAGSKVDSSMKRRKLVSEAIMEAETLSAPCREMLCALIPGSLGVRQESRDSLQTAGVGMLTQALDAREAALQGGVERAAAEVAAVAEATAKCAAEITELAEAVAAKSGETLSKKAALAENHGAVTTCTAALKEASDAQAGLAAELEETREQKECFEKVVAEHLVPLTDAPPTQKRDLKRHLAAIEAAVEPLGLDEALTLAIPNAFPKPLEKRGGFDQLVIEHVTKALAREVAARTEKLDQGTLATAERATTVQAAEAALEAAKSQRAAGSESLTTAEAEKSGLEAQLREARTRSRKLAGKTEAAAAAKVDRESALEAFRKVQAVFIVERDGQPAKVVEALPAVAEATLAMGGA